MTKQLLKASKCNPLTEEEWARFASLLDLSQVAEQDRQQVLDMFKGFAEVNPMVRRLYREQTMPFTISFTEEDMASLKAYNADGLSDGVGITWLRNLPEPVGIVVHEMLHIQQNKNKMFISDTTREFSLIANKVQEAEAASLSAYLMSSSGKYFDRLMNENVSKLEKAYKNGLLMIPYADGLTKQERTKAKNLYIHEQAVQKAMGQYIALLMQENGAPTQEMAASFGLDLTLEELNEIEGWREYYNKHVTVQADENHTIQEAGLSADEKKEAEFVRDNMIKRYPVLMDLPFFQTGFSVQDASRADIAVNPKKGRYTTYHQGTDKVLSERKIDENALFVTRVYRNDENHSLSYEVREDHLGKKEGKEVFYDRQGNLLRERIYKEGELVNCKDYNQDGGSHLVEYENGEAVKLTGFDLNGNVDYVEDYKKASLEPEIIQYGSVRKDIKNMVERYDKIGTYRTIEYKDGHVKEGYLTNDETPVPVGEWRLTSPDGVVKKAFYSGNVITDPKTGKKKPEKIQNPLIALKKNGYVCIPSDKQTKADFEKLKEQGLIDENASLENFYVKGNNGSVKFVCLSPTGLLQQSGEYKEYKEDEKERFLFKIGKWKKYGQHSELVKEEKFNEYGYLYQSDSYEVSTGRNTESQTAYNGVSTYYAYDVNGKTTKEAVYDEEIGDYLSRKEYYKNGKRHIVRENGIDYFYNPYGGLGGISNKDGEITFYPEDGVTDPNKLKKKRETTYIYDEQTNSWITSTTEYRKDGTIASISEMDENGNGSRVFFALDGKTKKAEGAIKNYNKTGEWTYYDKKGKVERTVNYEDDQIVSGETSHVNNSDAKYAMNKVGTSRPENVHRANLKALLAKNADKVLATDEPAVQLGQNITDDQAVAVPDGKGKGSK